MARTSSIFGHVYRRVYTGLNYRLRSFGDGRWASHCRPISITLLLTLLCNSRCVHCDIWKNKGKENTLTPEQWKAVLTDLRRWLGPVHVCFTGGEALLVPFALDLVEHAVKAGLFVELLTHGYWDDQSKFEKLALVNPGRVTFSLDGMGETHTKIRGRERFFEKTETSIRTLQRVRKEEGLTFTIRLKNVIMAHNLDDAEQVAHYANQDGMDVFFQPIEQNYNTPEDPRWFEHSENWPKDADKAARTVERLIALKREGLPIANSYAQLEAMIPYFRDPALLRVATLMHSAHEGRPLCAALTNMQLMPNGDVLLCYGMPTAGNVKEKPIREIWRKRPRWWEGGCCLERHCGISEMALSHPRAGESLNPR